MKIKAKLVYTFETELNPKDYGKDWDKSQILEFEKNNIANYDFDMIEGLTPVVTVEEINDK